MCIQHTSSRVGSLPSGKGIVSLMIGSSSGVDGGPCSAGLDSSFATSFSPKALANSSRALVAPSSSSIGLDFVLGSMPRIPSDERGEAHPCCRESLSVSETCMGTAAVSKVMSETNLIVSSPKTSVANLLVAAYLR